MSCFAVLDVLFKKVRVCSGARACREQWSHGATGPIEHHNLSIHGAQICARAFQIHISTLVVHSRNGIAIASITAELFLSTPNLFHPRTSAPG